MRRSASLQIKVEVHLARDRIRRTDDVEPCARRRLAARGPWPDRLDAQRLVAAGSSRPRKPPTTGCSDADPRRVDARLASLRAGIPARLREAQADFREVLAPIQQRRRALGARIRPGLVRSVRRGGSSSSGARSSLRRGSRRVKGLALRALWRGDGPEAARRFEAISRGRTAERGVQVVSVNRRRAGLHREARDAFAALARARARRPTRSGVWTASARQCAVRRHRFGGLTDSRIRARWPALRRDRRRSHRRRPDLFQVDDSLSLDAAGLAAAAFTCRPTSRCGQATWGGRLRHPPGRRLADAAPTAWRSGCCAPSRRCRRRARRLQSRWIGPRGDGLLEPAAMPRCRCLSATRLQLEPTIFYAAQWSSRRARVARSAGGHLPVHGRRRISGRRRGRQGLQPHARRSTERWPACVRRRSRP